MSVYSHERLSFFLQAAGKASAVDDKSKKVVSKRSPLFKSRPKVFGIGGDLRTPQGLAQHVPVSLCAGIKVQRQKQVLLSRIKAGCVVFRGAAEPSAYLPGPPGDSTSKNTPESR